MHTKQLNAEQYNMLKKNIPQKVKPELLNYSHQCILTIDDRITYLLDFKFCHSNMILELQAILIDAILNKIKQIQEYDILCLLTEVILIRYGTIEWK